MTTPGGPPPVPPGPTSSRGTGGVKPPAAEPAESRLTDEDISSLRDLAHGLMYAGFDTIRFRGLVRERIPARDLLKVLVAAAMVGNSPERLTGKISDPGIGRETLSLLNRYQIKSKGAVGANDLTLARVAACCAPLYHAVRTQVLDSIQNQDLNTGTAKDWQSPSLAVYGDRITGLREWLVLFGRRIKPRSETNESADSRTLQFMEIAIQNRSRDPFMDLANLDKTIKDLVQKIYA